MIFSSQALEWTARRRCVGAVTVNVPALSQDLSVQTILPRSGSLTIHPTPQWSLWWQCYLDQPKNLRTELNWTELKLYLLLLLSDWLHMAHEPTHDQQEQHQWLDPASCYFILIKDAFQRWGFSWPISLPYPLRSLFIYFRICKSAQ